MTPEADNEIGWYGVDLDGTLATYVDGQGNTIGKPIPAMIKRVEMWLAEGMDVRIMTARASGMFGPEDYEEQADRIETWCLEHLGQILPITARKDFSMIELWDDRTVGVIRNTGIEATDAAYGDGYRDGVNALDGLVEAMKT